MKWRRSTFSRVKRSFSNFGVSRNLLMTISSNGTKTALSLSRSSRGKTGACTITTRLFSSWRSSPNTPVFTRLGKTSDWFLPDSHAVNLMNSCFFSRYSRKDGRCSNYYVNIHVLKLERDAALLSGEIRSSDRNIRLICPQPIKLICKDFKGNFSWKKVPSVDNSITERFLQLKRCPP